MAHGWIKDMMLGGGMKWTFQFYGRGNRAPSTPTQTLQSASPFLLYINPPNWSISKQLKALKI